MHHSQAQTATIDDRKGRDGTTTYRARVRVLGFPPHTATFARKSDARQWARQPKADLRRGRHVPTNETMRRTVAHRVERYLEETLPAKARNRVWIGALL